MQATSLTDDGVALRASAHGAHVAFTGRAGGVSAAPFDSLNLGHRTGDDPAALARNHELAAALASPDRARDLVVGEQVHETTVAVHLAGGPKAPVEGVDAHVTTRTDLAIGVLTADCVPVALLAPWAVGVAHAGWRGLAGGVLAQTTDELLLLQGADADLGRVVGVIGPCAGACCYEVGPEVHAVFEGWLPGAPSGRTIDLARLAGAALQAAGVREVVYADRCTMCGPGYFSHRASGGTTGRQAGIAWRT